MFALLTIISSDRCHFPNFPAALEEGGNLGQYKAIWDNTSELLWKFIIIQARKNDGMFVVVFSEIFTGFFLTCGSQKVLPFFSGACHAKFFSTNRLILRDIANNRYSRTK